MHGGYMPRRPPPWQVAFYRYADDVIGFESAAPGGGGSRISFELLPR